MPVDPAIGKAWVKVTLTLGPLINVQGSLYSPQQTKRDEVHQICPECAHPTQFVGQRYICKENDKHGPFLPSETKLGQQEGDKIVVLDKEAVQEARTSVLPDKVLDLQVHKRSEVETVTTAKGGAYVFVPVGPSKVFSIIVDWLRENRALCLVAKANFKGNDHFVQIDVELNGQLVVRDLVFPEDMKAFPVPALTEYEERERAIAEQLFEAMLSPFNANEYRADSRDRVAAVVDEARDAKPAKKTATKATKQDSDALVTSLEAALAATKKTKRPARKAS